jgi:thioredoxin reductase (NADPH)
MPIQTADQQKCTREQYLAYIRATCMKYELAVNTYEEVKTISKRDGFSIETATSRGNKSYQVRYLVLATGGTANPRRLGIPGEDLPHVQNTLQDPHSYFGRKLVIVGGKNSAVEGALRAFHAGAHVTIITRSHQFDSKSIKYWLLPELEGRIKRNEIGCNFKTEVKEIARGKVKLSNGEELRADFVLKAIGFDADMRLFEELGIELGENKVPFFNEETMESNVEGVYVLGTAVGGTQKSFKVYIENTHHHVGKIMEDLASKLKIELPHRRWYTTMYTPSGPLEE